MAVLLSQWWLRTANREHFPTNSVVFAHADQVCLQTSESTDVTMNDVTEADDTADVRVLARADPARQVSLQAEAEVDPMEGEQTWPTADELAQADGEWRSRVLKRRP